MSSNETAWHGTERADGVIITPTPDGWTIEGPRGEIALCPCCERPMRTARAAQLVADAIYPFQEQGSHEQR